MKLSEAHLDLLRLIQSDATLTLEELAEKTAVSHTTLWRRLKALESEKVIRHRVTVLDPEAVGVTVCAFVYVNINSHDSKHRRDFEKLVDSTPEIMQCFSITGPHDYILNIRVVDIKAYEMLLMDKILAHPSVSSAACGASLTRSSAVAVRPWRDEGRGLWARRPATAHIHRCRRWPRSARSPDAARTEPLAGT